MRSIHTAPAVGTDVEATDPGAVAVRCAPDWLPIYTVGELTEHELDEAVAHAARAGRSWSRTTARQRGVILRDAATLLRQRVEETALTLVRETGKVIEQARREVLGSADVLDSYAEIRLDAVSRVVTDASPRVWGFEYAEPLGVAALIGAWNVPLQLAAHKIGAALMAGCTAVVKPSPLAVGSVRDLVGCFAAAGLPEDVLALVTGGIETGKALTRHPGIDVISFTGGVAAGRSVMANAAAGPRKLILELGGKSANIVFADAPRENLAQGLLNGFIRNQGAVCTAATRIFVEQERFEEVVQDLEAQVRTLRVGDPYQPGNDLGALRTPELAHAFDSVVAEAGTTAGARVIGGESAVVPGRTGHYRRPAIVALSQVQSTRLTSEELFVPIAAIMPFTSEDEIIDLVNDSEYGLAAGIWTQDLSRAERTWRAINAGTVYINSYHRIDSNPLTSSGRRSSGFGAEGGLAGVAEFTGIKSVHIPRAAQHH